MRELPVKRPEYVRGALFSSHAHEWDYKTGVAHVGVGWVRRERGLVYSAIVWTRKRRYTKP